MGSKLSTAEDHVRGVDLSGKNIIITGASAGLGRETARALALAKGNLYLCNRSRSKSEPIIDELKKETHNENIHFLELNLADFASVRSCAEAFLRLAIPLDVIILNAGVMACPYNITKDGFEEQFQTNHLSHFLLTMLLLPALSKASESRVVVVSSGAHAICGVNFDDINFKHTNTMLGWRTYGQSKTANILFAQELSKRHPNVAAFSLHPGAIPTELQRHMGVNSLFGAIGNYLPGMVSIPEGAATSVFLATAPIQSLTRGGFYEFSKLSAPRFSYATDAKNAERLWDLSLDAVKLPQQQQQ